MPKVKRCAHPLRFALAFLTALTAIATPMPLLAQSDCHVDELSRDDGGQRRLAVKIDTGWQFFKPNDDALTHAIEVGGLQELCMAWEAPPYEGGRRQIVYVSTQYRDDQPIWLVRHNQAAGIPFLGRLLGDWGRQADASGANPDQAFKEFHHRLPPDPGAAPWNNLTDWHNTSAWLTNRQSYEVVRVVIDLAGFPFGTERLLMLRGGRSFTSWIPFTTHAPSGRDKLRVAVSYSGDLDVDGSGPRVYQYVFEVGS